MSWQNNLQDWRVQLRQSCKLVLMLDPERSSLGETKLQTSGLTVWRCCCDTI